MYKAVFAVLIAITSFNSYAWGEKAHKQILHQAFLSLNAQQQQWFMSLLKLKDIHTTDYAAVWADVIKHKPSMEWTKPQHYINVERSADTIDLANDCTKHCIVKSIINNYQKAIDEKASDETRAISLLYLVHYIADLHQPLHVSFADDFGGAKPKLLVNGTLRSWHYIWDVSLAEYIDIGSVSTSENEPFSPHLHSLAWAQESLQITKSFIYSGEFQSDWSTGAEKSKSIVDRRLTLAASRTAMVLSFIYTGLNTR